MFLDKEKTDNKASQYYRKIKLLESKILQYVLFAAILMNAVCGYGIASEFGMNSKTGLAVKIAGIACELLIIFITICLFRISEFKFNRLVENGIILKTEIEQNKSWVMLSGKSSRAIIHSRYICEDGSPLLFNQTSNVSIGREVMFSSQLKKENYIDVIVNPNKSSEYCMMIQEIGVKQEKKYEVPYGNKTISIILLLLIALEYMIWTFYF